MLKLRVSIYLLEWELAGRPSPSWSRTAGSSWCTFGHFAEMEEMTLMMITLTQCHLSTSPTHVRGWSWSSSTGSAATRYGLVGDRADLLGLHRVGAGPHLAHGLGHIVTLLSVLCGVGGLLNNTSQKKYSDIFSSF